MSVTVYSSTAEAHSHAHHHIQHFTPFTVLNVDASPSPLADFHTYLLPEVKDVAVQVSVAPTGQPFSGDSMKALSMEMSLCEFITSMQSPSDTASLSIYLSQCAVLSNEHGIPAVLPQLQPHLNM